MILYKYLPPARADVLENHQIRFTQPDAFNDPFESNPCFASLLEAELVDEVCQPNEDYDLEEHARFTKQMKDMLASSESKKWKVDNTVNKIAILCLSSRMDGVLMWSHYADSHRGFVIGFDSEHDSIRNRKDGERHRLEVKYTNERPKGETLEKFSLEELFCTKSEEWIYEKEWRLFDAKFNADVNNPQVSLFKFDPAAVREVILGARMPGNVRAEILAILAQPEYAHVKVRQAELHRFEYRVEIRDVSPS